MERIYTSGKKYLKLLYRLKHPIPKDYIICLICGKKVECVQHAMNQKFCKDCKILNKRNYQKTYHTKYRQTENGKINARKGINRRRLRMNNLKEDFTMEEWLKKVDDTEGICPGYNHEPHFVGKNQLTLDHTPPVSKAPEGFCYTINNVSPLCRRCNTRKRDKE